MKQTLTFISVLALLVITSCSQKSDPLKTGLDSFSADELTAHIQVLASDEFEGRMPASPGEEKSVEYMVAEFKRLGLQPANGDSYLQEVPLVGITANTNSKLYVEGKDEKAEFLFSTDYMAWTKRVADTVGFTKSEMVFVGYGIIAPEYGWNDYEGVDVKGKTVVMFVNDPGFATQDPALFTGNSMTYYGRWTYKYEEAARQGAAGVLIIHETKPAAYPWAVVQNSNVGKQFDLVAADKNMSRCSIEGWVTYEAASKILHMGGRDIVSLKEAALAPDFTAIPLGINSSLTLYNEIEFSRSDNVVAMIKGSERPDEYIMYTAHWDHLGRDTTLEGDQIYNGARDNASGIAGLFELAKAFMKSGVPPKRSIVFAAVTAEEQGLLGSAHLATNPLFPSNKTVATINMDGLNDFGKMKDISVVGYNYSELDDYLADAAKEEGKTVTPESNPEKGYYYRSDHFNFAKQGIPSLYTKNGTDHVDHGKDWVTAEQDKWVEERYHKVADEFDPARDWSGAIDDLRILFRIGFKLSVESTFPNWRENNEFRAIRDADRQ